MAFVEVSRLSKVYERNGQRLVALDDVSFEVARGEFIVIVGPSGCGKSTLLRLIAGLRTASSGTVKVDGQIVTRPLRVGMVFQTPALIAARRVLGNVMLAPDLAGLPASRFRARALELLQMVGLAEFLDRRPYELSGGMQQRVALCRALVHDPDLLLMDEPFGALDAITRDEMGVELLRFWGAAGADKTVLFVTHSIPEAIFLADRILVMTPRPGRIASFPRSVLKRPRDISMRGQEGFARQSYEIYEMLHGVEGRTSKATSGWPGPQG